MNNGTRAADRRNGQLPALPPVPLQKIDDDDLQQVRSWFVPQAGYESARKLLSPSQPVLILTGPTGSGKRTTALRLLQERSELRRDEIGAGLALRELVPDWEEPDPQRLPVEPEHGYLFDLGRYDQRLLWPFAKGLQHYHAARLTAAGSYLVVTGTDAHWEDCEGVLTQARIRLDQPAPARSIVELRVPEHRRGWLDHPMMRRLLLDRLVPADAVRLAEAIQRAPADDESGIAYARTEYRRGRWWPDLAEWFAAHPRSAERALLIAAAVLDGCPADEIWQAGRALSRLMGGDAPATDPLAGPGRTRLLKVLGLPELRPDGVVSLTGQRPGFDDAVIDYVMAEYPQLSGGLWAWITDTTMTAGYVQRRVERVAQAIAGRSARYSRAVFLTRLPRLADGDVGHRRLARAVLERTVRDPAIGASVRRRIACWAKHPGTRESLLAVIAEVCGGALAEQFPVVALAMLRRILLRRDSVAVERAALASLVRLAARSELRRLALNMVVRWMGEPAHRYAGGVAFLRLMHPGDSSIGSQLTSQDADDPQVFRLLRLGWQWLPGTGVPESQATELMSAWEAAARGGQLRRDMVADLLLLAVEPDVRRIVAGTSGTAASGDTPGGRREQLVGRVLTLR